MILVYHLSVSDGFSLKIRPYSLEINKGRPLSGVRFPHSPEKLLKQGAAGVSLRPLDRKILMSLILHLGRDGVAECKGRDVTKLLALLSDTGRAYLAWNESAPIRFLDRPLSASLGWISNEEGLKPWVELPEGHRLLPGKPAVVFRTGDSACATLRTGADDSLTWSWIATPLMAGEKAGEFFRAISTRNPHTPLPPPPSHDVTVLEAREPVPVLRVGTRRHARGLGLWVEPLYRYGEQLVTEGEGGERIRFFEKGKLYDAPRAARFEKGRLRQLGNVGFVPAGTNTDNLFDAAAAPRRLKPLEDVKWPEILGEIFPALEAKGWDIQFVEGGQPVVPGNSDWYTEIREGKRGWLSFEQGVRVNGVPVNLLPALHAFLRDRVDVEIEDLRKELENNDVPVEGPDCLVMIPGARFLRMVEHLFELYGGQALDEDQCLRLSPWRAAELAESEFTVWRPPEELLQTVRALRGGLTVEPLAPPDTFRGKLRPYQEEGVGWLNFLQETRLGGILADDMGLGKTVQVLAALDHRRRLNPEAPPVLIVCPASVLPNWRRESERFTPHLDLRVLHGNERSTDPEDLRGAHLLLTTYTMLWRDEALYAKLPLSTVVFDEAQAVKNPRARAHAAAATVKAEVKLALTGTPCENHLGDLWALFNLVTPGFLGGEKEFRLGYRVPIEKENCPVLRRSLINRIRPLMLRRTKERVAADLPPKTEIVVSVPLSDAQTDLYHTVRAAMCDKVREDMARQGLARSRIVVLDAMLKLRQICCDPRLRDPEGAYEIPADSAKLAHLLDMLEELVDEGRRVLLFSQFTSMLDLMHPELRKRKISWVEIRGDTRDRDTPVQRFQAGKVPLFLISLKAGGSGLNLTAADTVIHYDPWWNPAVEAQATDRAHRIGQDKPVFVYKLVAEGSIETSILRMQEEKRNLAGILESEGATSLALDEKEINRLLAPLGVSS